MKQKKPKTKILFASAELTPLAKVGGLADVAGSLPKALHTLNIDIRVIIPYYQNILKQKISAQKIHANLIVPFGNKKYKVDIFKSCIPQSHVPLYLIYHKKFLSTGPIYNRRPERFMFFSQAINEFLKINIFNPDIIHINDWHPANLISLLQNDSTHTNKYRTLLTIHNLAMQGKLPNNKMKLFHPSLWQKKSTNEYNTMRQAIISSDLINTVSKKYAREILTPEYSCHLLPLLHKHQNKIYGILNGIDYSLFSPQKDKFLKKNYSIHSMTNKSINKLFLQKTCNLPLDNSLPIIGLVSRLTKQKGIQLIIEIGDKLAKLNAQYIFTGTGDKKLEQGLKNLHTKYPNKFYFLNFFDVPFGQQIYGGADLFLMPSVFEPCGLGQLIAMAYGTVPIVRATGGLKDTVKNNKIGFTFNAINSSQLLSTVKKSISVYQNKKIWSNIVFNAMSADFSWSASALAYQKLYSKLLSSKKCPSFFPTKS
ncbi:MAG: glycogen/starch synthase [Patescibacteria group bacterium]